MRPWGAGLRAAVHAGAEACAIVLVCLMVGCNSPPPKKEAAPTAKPVPTATEGVEQPSRVDLEKPSAIAFGEKMGEIYQRARSLMGQSGGSVRYWGNPFDRIEVSAALPEDAVGFDDFKFSADCAQAAAKSPVCIVGRAFAPADVAQAVAALKQFSPNGSLEVHVVGKADGAWKKSKVPKTYDGACGEGQCATEKTTLTLSRGMGIESNETLACLRALCTWSLSGLSETGVTPKLRAVVIGTGVAASGRKAEVGMFAMLPPEHRGKIWDAFLRKVGHK